ncbi:hypothetical protein [Arthrobacter sp. JCM 19049]|uniref:hypothetical protein n=1 Tax=Arthrobacter sp. JCM 19049 TaxID=1460643 RepID=UPI0006D1A996|nr:hypothetical protein [Arthrobacter sp. JCM 19049]
MTDRLNPEALEAACAGFYNDPMGLTNWQRLCSADPALADKYRAGMNAAVTAYLAALPAPRPVTNPLTVPHRITTGAVSDVGNMGVPTPDTVPRTITTVEGLEALPEGTILRDYAGLALHKRPTGTWWCTNGTTGLTDVDLADEIEGTKFWYTVLWVPPEGGGTTILALLNEHRQRHSIRDGRTHCACGWKSGPRVMGAKPHSASSVMEPDSYGAHLAGLLEAHQHEREAKAKAEALEEAASDSHMGLWCTDGTLLALHHGFVPVPSRSARPRDACSSVPGAPCAALASFLALERPTP